MSDLLSENNPSPPAGQLLTLREVCAKTGLSEHTIRYYTDQGLLPCQRDSGNRRVFDEESLHWIQGIKCLKGCGMSIASIRNYFQLCRLPESRENLMARYRMIVEYRDLAYRQLQDAKDRVSYMERKTRHYEDILAGLIPDDTIFHPSSGSACTDQKQDIQKKGNAK